MDIQTNLTIQKKAIGIEFKALHIVKHENGTQAYIQFQINFENSSPELYEVKKEGEDFNTFFGSFNSVKSLYEEVFLSLGLDSSILPSDDMNESIYNSVDVQN